MRTVNVLLVASREDNTLVNTTNFPNWKIQYLNSSKNLQSISKDILDIIIFDDSTFDGKTDDFFHEVAEAMSPVPSVYIIKGERL